MMTIDNTVEYFNDRFFHIQHPYADFTFVTKKPLMCNGTLSISVWELKGKISFDGVKWYNIENLNSKDDNFISFFYDFMFDNYGWVYQDIYLTIKEIINKSIIKSFKIISISNEKPSEYIFKCNEISQMDRKLLLKLDDAKKLLSSEFDIVDLSLTEEQIVIINIKDNTLPEVDLVYDEISDDYNQIILDIEKKLHYILKGVGITRFSLGKIHKY